MGRSTSSIRVRRDVPRHESYVQHAKPERHVAQCTVAHTRDEKSWQEQGFEMHTRPELGAEVAVAASAGSVRADQFVRVHISDEHVVHRRS
eukprot:2555438-Pleurochrysis_carterae.AAC.1